MTLDGSRQINDRVAVERLTEQHVCTHDARNRTRRGRAKAAGLRVGAYYYTYARTRAAVANELTTFLNVMDGLQLEYPVFVDVEDSSLTSLGSAELTSLVQYAMDILYQRKWYAGWYSYTNYINSYLNAAALSQ